ncbi:hypothetical protein RISK_003985 [Rhodopirellula islandica]|uniref:Uncharacterized protein n=1 Tax=Rhodopirellula islandica TaxID=595434 RepID=A0A0J1BBX9_RHOIS|nr:hypothetical protein RISK_003985 [Rhodopirellula islandica]
MKQTATSVSFSRNNHCVKHLRRETQSLHPVVLFSRPI